ncbi:MAG TPA: DMT family transporter [Thermoplasmata archaeon]|nr:DMT family transporter [Thermoplasmata archaeon]
MRVDLAATVTASPGSGRFGITEVGILVLTSLVWGAAYVFIRQGIVLGAGPLAFAAVRYALSAAAFAGLALARRERAPSREALLASAVIGGVLVIGLYGGFLYWGEQSSTGGYAAVLAATAPLLTVIVGFSLLPDERLGTLGLGGIALGLAGTAVLVYPELSGSPLGSWQGPIFILAAMVCPASGSVLLRRYGRGRQNLWQIGTQFLVAGLILGIASFAVPGPNALPLTEGVWGSLVFLVVLSSVVGYFAYYALHFRVGPVRANVVAYLAPLVGLAIGSGIFGEPVTTFELAGVAVVLAGVTLVLWEATHRGASPT